MDYRIIDVWGLGREMIMKLRFGSRSKKFKNHCDRRIYYHVFCSQLFGFFPLGLCRRQPRNRQIHLQVCWKCHRISGVVGKQGNIGFVGFLGNVEQKWCRRYRKWVCCEIFVTKSKLKASLAVWRNLCLTFFREGCTPAARLDEPPLLTSIDLTAFIPTWKHEWRWAQW